MHKKNLLEYYNKNKVFLPIICILIIGTFLRFYKLDFQSLWLDELFSATEVNPKLTWHETLELVLQNEQQSPFFFFLLKLLCKVFGYTDWVMRFLPAIGGVLGIFFTFKLAREICNDEIANIAALFCAINYFHITYSQDARVYSLVFLFSTLTSLYFVRLIKKPNLITALKYTFIALCLNWLHYITILILFSHAILGLVALVKVESVKQKQFIRLFVIIILVYCAGMYPLLKQIVLLTEKSTFWTTNPSSYFYIDLFTAFWGYSGITTALMLVCFSLFVFSSFLTSNKIYDKLVLNTPMLLSVLVFMPVVFGYIRSLNSPSIIVDRYFIFILPYLILMMASGVQAIISNQVKYSLIGLIVIASIVIIWGEQKHYTTLKKDDFKGVVNFIENTMPENDTNYFILSDKNRFLKYYFDKYNIHPKLIDNSDYTFSFTTDKIYSNHLLVIDTSLKDVWIASAHHANLNKMKAITDTLLLSDRFILKETFESKDAFAHHLLRKY